MKKRFIAISLALAIVVGLLCMNTIPDVKASECYNLAGVDALGRTLPAATTPDETKAVGIFYFLWLGASSAEGPYDVTKILENDPNAAVSDEAWLAAGGGAVGTRHWWGESLFGYYRATDSWVIERDVQMLTDAGVDFLALDYSNATEYPQQLLVLLKALDKYYKQGFDVPQVTFITKSNSGQIVMNLYETVYQTYTSYSHLWYCMDGKPLMIGVQDDEAVSEECREYFTWRHPQWPREEYNDNGFPWMDFGETQTLYGEGTGTTVMSVSVAQHSGTLAMSSSALYGDDTNRTRSYHDGTNDTSENAVLYGYNFAQQFEYAIEVEPDIIFVTGWNEWIATRQEVWEDINGNSITDPVILVDNCDINNSRDIQPMKGGYGDNYYMQLVGYIRQYKGGAKANNKLASMQEKAQTTNDTVKVYLDYTGDTNDRNHQGFGTLVYTDTTGRNDLHKMKMANDYYYLYAYAKTSSDITGTDGDHCMTLFLNTGADSDNWCGYDYVISRTSMGIIEKRTADGWTAVGTVDYNYSGNQLQYMIPLSAIGLLGGQESTIEFKWADNYQGEDDIFSFYLNGDVAPYGRLNYVYTLTAVADDAKQPQVQEVVAGGEALVDTRQEVSAGISSHEIIGTWVKDNATSTSVGPQNSYDGSSTSKWNPQATSYNAGEGIVYTLDGAYDLSQIQLTFGTRKYYFDLSVSADGQNYTKVAQIRSNNADEYYTDYTCTVPQLRNYNIRYIKVEFIGSSDTSKFVNLFEVTVTGKTAL